ncbi:NADH-quinone oxidoreductase subunit L [Demequina sp. TTPB684]|uniref:NADH-quinone oxidoreductase subunit L n=1 Tax=unclassified Demequina TaxID=2620311 RepID=UPI001CF46E7B|nr:MULTISPECIES: NADH-quinone oxidoreductase subunit L [unclassified Demequina]MCB2411801.1 NADH-quinone oxidoreductase subunit L [Demequina sp. TTPB684]UPU88315.1 NADH-quinone oxidoreductase subunit L [Demequina sp. TMPB413]
MLSVTWLLIAVPLASFFVLMLAGRRADAWGHWLGVAASSATAVIGIGAFFQMLGRDAEARSESVHLFTWLSGSDLHLDAGLLVDQLSLTFVMLVTVVGTLIHVYSVAYMEHDPNRRMFFAYLNLFIAAMLLLVLADSYLLLFVGWEGVGLASYLLIGFWNHKNEYATAANKAFVVNRVGDVGLIIAMGLMFAHFGSLNFADVLGSVDQVSTPVLTAIGLTLLLAATGKSAQFPLQSWLGDAMAGPTPVSALIHAATMVTAGVYLIVRSGAIYEAADDARVVVAIVGAVTLIMGAIIGSAKDDIKKALAASTMSQIGYMMLAAGLGPVGYVFAIFHLVTHGFFKAGMFLGAGSVMHGMNDQTDMRRFGALRTAMVTTWITFGLGWLAILGVPPFSGFWSKDKIIESAFVGEGWQPWVFGLTALIGAGMTAFYMSRLFFMTFHGKARWTDDQHPHESSLLMTVPMIVLAAGSAFLGLFLAVGNRFQHWLEPVTGAHGEHHPVLSVPVITTLTLLLVAAGAALAYWIYWRHDVPTEAPPPSLGVLAARNDLFQDSVNRAVFQIPGTHLTRTLVYADAALVDGAVNKQATGVAAFGEASRRFQSGKVRSYAMLMLLGFLVLASIIVVGG